MVVVSGDKKSKSSQKAPADVPLPDHNEQDDALHDEEEDRTELPIVVAAHRASLIDWAVKRREARENAIRRAERATAQADAREKARRRAERNKAKTEE